MNAPMDLQARVQQYLTERRRLGFVSLRQICMNSV